MPPHAVIHAHPDIKLIHAGHLWFSVGSHKEGELYEIFIYLIISSVSRSCDHKTHAMPTINCNRHKKNAYSMWRMNLYIKNVSALFTLISSQMFVFSQNIHFVVGYNLTEYFLKI